MTDFNSNTWYAFQSRPKNNALSLASSASLFDGNGTTGSVFAQRTNHSNPQQRWQLVLTSPTEPLYYLRSEALGPDALLQTFTQQEAQGRGTTTPFMSTVNGDNATHWEFETTGNAQYWWLMNQANGTVIATGNNGLMYLSSNLSDESTHYTWTSLAAIDDQKYSAVNYNLPGQPNLR